MRTPTPLPLETKDLLGKLLKQASNKLEYQRVQCIWLRVALGLSYLQIASAIGWHYSTVKKLQARYSKEGESALKIKPRGGRYRANLSLEGEKSFLAPFLEKSERGGILIVSEIKLAYEKKIGHKVPKSTISRMLARQGWRKVVPGHRHPKGDAVKQEAFKKNLRK
ncbi:MAG: winged helix-turn-helix domain-containing protein [bacterium]|nr:winged helix-turn-helix domain-containing protein [bacterium]